MGIQRRSSAQPTLLPRFAPKHRLARSDMAAAGTSFALATFPKHIRFPKTYPPCVAGGDSEDVGSTPAVSKSDILLPLDLADIQAIASRPFCRSLFGVIGLMLSF